MSRARVSLRAFVLGSALFFALCACGSSGGGGVTASSASSASSTCNSTSDCATDEYCVFPIGSCDAKGSCIGAVDAGPACGPAVCAFYNARPGCWEGATVLVCGCGTEQKAGCGWSGGASGPTTGAPCP
jgi:hypothetical protein